MNEKAVDLFKALEAKGFPVSGVAVKPRGAYMVGFDVVPDESYSPEEHDSLVPRQWEGYGVKICPKKEQ